MRSKAMSLLGFAKKSGNLVSGVNTCTFAISKGKAKLVILAEDISAGSEKNIKLTTVDDIDIFKALLTTKRSDWLKTNGN